MSNRTQRGAASPPARGGGFRLMAGVLLVVAALYLGKTLFVPLVFAGLFTFILSPVVVFLQQRGVGRAPSVLLVVLGALAAAGSVAYLVASQLLSLAAELPTHRAEIEQKLADLHGITGGGVSRLVDMLQELVAAQTAPPDAPHPFVVVAQPAESGFEQVKTFLAPFVGGLAEAFFVLLLVIFMLLRREDVRNRAIRLLGYGHLTGTTRAAMDAGARVSRLLLSQLAINACFGLTLGVGLWALGVPYAFLWGFSAGALRFVPYLGIVVAVVAPVIFSIATSPGWELPLVVLGFIMVVEIVTANAIEPILFSKKTGVSPLALLVAAAFWTFIWGPIGLVLSTPLTICLVVLGNHAPQFGFLAVLLGDEPALEPHVTFYQRLLASDEIEARGVASAYAAEHGAVAAFDMVLVPALRRVRRDRQKEGLGARDAAWIADATRRVAAELALDAPSGESVATDGARPRILACPAHHAAEEAGLEMFARICRASGAEVDVLPQRTLPAAVESAVERGGYGLVFIGILPPGGLAQAEHLCQRLAARWPELPIVVGHWKRPKSYDQLLVRLREAGATYVATTIAQAASQALSAVTPAAAEPDAQGP
ncbi:MAG: AI-2E family transporter [Deltaproteobacteria bacterium]|nr:AI-2E family transporter [Deltaproteobacteria bacterium]